MYCQQCGTINNDQSAFCMQCGASLSGVTQNAAPPIVVTGMAVKYAGFWRRFLAYIIDGILTSAVVLPISFVLGFIGGMYGDIFATGILFVFYPLIIVGGWLYFALMESSSHQGTLGKMALRIIVTDLDGKRISFGKATGRHFGKILSGIILYIGYIMIAFTTKKQGLHDMMANTLIIQK